MLTLSVGHKFPECRFGPLSPAQVADYAAASGDDNPLHADAELARGFGFAAPLVHGMLMMGLIEAACRSWGLTTEIVEIETRFVSPVIHGAELRYHGTVVTAQSDQLRIRILIRDLRDTLCVVGSIALRV